MSLYTVPALDAVDFALTAHTVPSIASPTTALQLHTVPALTAADFALAVYTPPTYMDIGWELTPSGAPPITGDLTFAAELGADVVGVESFLGSLDMAAELAAALSGTSVVAVTGTMTLAAELAADALGIGGISAAARPRLVNRSGPLTPGPLTLALARPPRGARRPSLLPRR